MSFRLPRRHRSYYRQDALDWLIEVGWRSMSIILWAFSFILSLSFVGLFFYWLTFSDDLHPWDPSQLLALLNLIWMVPILTIVWWGSFAFAEEAWG